MDWLRNMHDWMISKKRYWGLSLPIWTCESCSRFDVIGDEVELENRAVEGWETFEGHTPHRPYIDAIKLTCPDCGARMSRIPDVGNPWLDAGIIGFSTLQYRTNREYWRQWYPANWISESFPGQFRNWFYSLLAMATVIDRSPPFLENFGYALLFAEDGRAMHKSWGNMIEFNEAADKMGVDVMRWQYCAHKPENNLLFGYKRGDEVRRQVVIPLWNVYNFFVTYASLDGWEPDASSFDPAFPEGGTPTSWNPLDRWIISRLNEVLAQSERSLLDSDTYSATLFLSTLIDDLTNWYVRRSRRRFWKSDLDDDKASAYRTLYHVLVKLIRVLAPFMPFVTEVMYQNLVRSVVPDAYESIHHTSWPLADEGAVRASLAEQMALARKVASLGLSARSSAGIKLRQPLAEVVVYTGQAGDILEGEVAAIVQDELNVKSFRFVTQSSDLMSYQILPNNQLLGPRFGQKFPAVRASLAAANPAEIAEKVLAGEAVEITLEGEVVTLAPEEILVQTHPAERFAVAVDRGTIVAVGTEISPALLAEGQAREIVRRIQALRKEAGFNIEDRIRTYYQTESALGSVMKDWADFIKSETLSLELNDTAPAEGAYSKQMKIDEDEILIGVKN
jgi:isoleucyl-tRNA synthetase